MLVTFGRELMALGLELSAFIGKLLYFQSVHQKGHLEVMALEEIRDSPDADAVAVFALRNQGHVLLENSLRRWKGGAAVTLQRFMGGKVLRPNLPWHNESHSGLLFVLPFYRFGSTHGFSPHFTICFFSLDTTQVHSVGL